MSNMANTAAYALPDGRQAVDVDTSKTLTVADSGYVQNVIADGVVLTSPATAAQGSFTARNGQKVKPSDNPSGDGLVGFSVAPVAADQMQGGVGGSAVDNKALINTKATSTYGDEISWMCVAETNGPIVTRVKGIWARAA